MKFDVYMLGYGKGEIRKVDVPDQELTGKQIQDLERIFYWGQNDFQPQQIYSVSVGDVAEYQGKFFVVCGCGWKEMKKSEFEKYRKSEKRDPIDFMFAVKE